MKHILVIQEDSTVIGVATTVEKSLELIKEYFGENSEVKDIRYVEDSGIEFDCKVFVKEEDGYFYDVTVYYFITDEL